MSNSHYIAKFSGRPVQKEEEQENDYYYQPESNFAVSNISPDMTRPVRGALQAGTHTQINTFSIHTRPIYSNTNDSAHSKFDQLQDKNPQSRNASSFKYESVSTKDGPQTRSRIVPYGEQHFINFNSNISPLQKLARQRQATPELYERDHRSSERTILQIFTQQHEEIQKSAEQARKLKEKNSKQAELINDQQIAMDQMIQVIKRFEMEKVQASTSGPQIPAETAKSRSRRQSKASFGMVDQAMSNEVPEIRECLNNSLKVRNGVVKFLNESGFVDLRCHSSIKEEMKEKKPQKEVEEVKASPPSHKKKISHLGKGKSFLIMPNERRRPSQRTKKSTPIFGNSKKPQQDETSEDVRMESSDETDKDHNEKNVATSLDEEMKSLALDNPKKHKVYSEDETFSDDYEEESEDENYSAFKPISKKKSTRSRKGYKKATQKQAKAITKSKSKSQKRENEDFQCDKCGEIFHSGWALGGHASRVHPGESAAYRKKVQRREERSEERKILLMAKQMHQDYYGKNAPLNRVKIRKFKKDIKRRLAEEWSNE